jgi:hypothetical protein
MLPLKVSQEPASVSTEYAAVEQDQHDRNDQAQPVAGLPQSSRLSECVVASIGLATGTRSNENVTPVFMSIAEVWR